MLENYVCPFERRSSMTTTRRGTIFRWLEMSSSRSTMTEVANLPKPTTRECSITIFTMTSSRMFATTTRVLISGTKLVWNIRHRHRRFEGEFRGTNFKWYWSSERPCSEKTLQESYISEFVKLWDVPWCHLLSFSLILVSYLCWGTIMSHR